MDCQGHLLSIGSIVFLAYTIMASAYWQDMTRLGAGLKNADDEKTREWITSQMRVALLLFRASTGTMLFTIAIIVLPIYYPNPLVCEICSYALLIPLVGIVFMCIRYTMAKFYIKYKPGP